jgi:hypothetical protein
VALLGLAGGLGMAAHNLVLLNLPASAAVLLALVIRRKLHPGLIGLYAGCWLVGAGPYLVLIVLEAGRIGWPEAIRSALFGRAWQSAVLTGSLKAVPMGMGYVLYNLPNLALPLALLGLWRLRRRLSTGPMLVGLYLLAVYFWFAIRYSVPDQFMFFVPFYAVTAVLAGVGLGSIHREKARRLSSALAIVLMLATPAIYLVAPCLWQPLGLPLPGRKDLPRDPARYWLQPWKHAENSAGEFGRMALFQAPPNSIILADETSSYPLRWARRVHGLGRQTAIVRNDRAREVVAPGMARVFTVSKHPSYVPKWIRQRAELVELHDGGVLYEVRWRPGATAPAGDSAD